MSVLDGIHISCYGKGGGGGWSAIWFLNDGRSKSGLTSIAHPVGIRHFTTWTQTGSRLAAWVQSVVAVPNLRMPEYKVKYLKFTSCVAEKISGLTLPAN